MPDMVSSDLPASCENRVLPPAPAPVSAPASAPAPVPAQSEGQSHAHPRGHHPKLLARTLTGLRTTGILTAVKTVIDLGGQLALARLLAPGAFGFFAFAQSLSGLVSCFTDLAGQRYLIQKKEALERHTIDAVFTFELLLGVIVGGLWAALAGPLLGALGHPEQVPFAQALAVWIVLERLMLPRALLDREMAFGRSNLALVAGTAASAASMILAAAAGAGAWTFIIGLIVRSGVSAAAMWLWAPIRPRLRLDWAQVRPLALFGLPILVTTALTFYYTNIDYIIVQAALGYSAVGLYYAAYRYPHYVHQFQYLVSTVVFPAFSKAKDRAQLARGFSMVTKYACAVGLAPALVVWVLGESAVRTLLSEKWVPATFCFQVFTFLAVLRLTTVYWYDVYVSQGLTRPIPWISGGNAVLTTLGAAVGVWWAGIEGAAVLVTAASTLTVFFCGGVLLKRLLAVRYVAILRVPLAAAAVAGWIGFALARAPWIGTPQSTFLIGAYDFVLRSLFVCGIYAATFYILDRRELASILHRWRAGGANQPQ